MPGDRFIALDVPGNGALHPLAGHDLVLDAGKWVDAEIASYLNAPCSGADDEGQRDSEDCRGLSTPRAVKP